VVVTSGATQVMSLMAAAASQTTMGSWNPDVCEEEEKGHVTTPISNKKSPRHENCLVYTMCR